MLAPIGNQIRRREYVLTFRSGDHWSTNDLPNGITSERKLEVIQYISRASGVPIRNVAVLPSDEL